MKPVIYGGASLHQGDCRELLRSLPSGCADLCIADPPYGDTSLEWDRVVDGWLPEVSRVLKPNGSIWLFGSLRFLAPMFALMEAEGFKYSQDLVWEKQNGTGFHNDRFRRVHEHAVLFYRGAWGDVYHDTQYTLDATAKTVRRKMRPAHTGNIDAGHYVSEDGGPRMMRSVLRVNNEHGKAIHPTQKPVDLLRPIIRYSCPPGGLIIEPFMGSASGGEASLSEGRRWAGFELKVDYFEQAEARLNEFVNPAQAPLFADNGSITTPMVGEKV